MIETLAAGISALGLILVAIVGSRMNGRVKNVQSQVQNDHSTNLREELDDRHGETRDWFRDLRRDVGGIREELRGIRTEQRAQSERIRIIEQKGHQ